MQFVLSVISILNSLTTKLAAFFTKRKTGKNPQVHRQLLAVLCTLSIKLGVRH
jgi:hypothetical protein